MRELLDDVTARLVRHELYVARFYLQRDNFEAAVLRIQYAMRNFAISSVAQDPLHQSLEPDALLLLGETYLKMHTWPDAREAFTVIVQRYTASGLTVPAKNYLEYMRQRGV